MQVDTSTTRLLDGYCDDSRQPFDCKDANNDEPVPKQDLQ